MQSKFKNRRNLLLKKCFKAALNLFLITVVLFSYMSNVFSADISSIPDNILSYKFSQCATENTQDFINNYLTENAGNGPAEWYALALSRTGGYDFTNYISSLESLDLNSMKSTDAIRIELADMYLGGNLDAGSVVDTNWNKLGIMTEIYSLILINSGDFQCSTSDTEIVNSIISKQLSDGGWTISGKYADTDVTAMALQALSSYSHTSIGQASVEKGIQCLSGLQQQDGGYKSYGSPNCESCSQVLLAMCQLGINPYTDERFIKNGYGVTDALYSFANADGSFSHKTGEQANEISTVQAYMASVALNNFNNGGIYHLKKYDDQSNLQPPSETAMIQNSDEISTGNIEGNKSTTTNNAETKANVKTTSAVSAQTTTISKADSNSKKISETTVKAASKHISNSSKISSTTEKKINTGCIKHSDTSPSGVFTIKLVIVISILILLITTLIILKSRKMLTLKKALTLVLIAVLSASAVCFLKIQSVNEHYSCNDLQVSDADEYVTMSVRCDTIADSVGNDSVIIAENEFCIEDGDTVFDVLKRTLDKNKIPFDYSGTDGSKITNVYIRGINNIYEFDYGEMSGWMYKVNGKFPDTSCGNYVLKSGDVIEWLYTKDIGNDLED